MPVINLIIIPSIASETSPSRLLRVRETAPRMELFYTEQKNVTVELMRGCEVIYGCPPPEMLLEAPYLKWHHLPNAGIEPYGDLSLYANRAVTLTNASGVYGITIAEHVLGMALALLRQFPYYAKQQAEGGWARHPVMRELAGSSVLVCGLGDLGSRTADVFRKMGCIIDGVRRNINEIPPGFRDIFHLRQIEEAVRGADIVISCLPDTPGTRGVFSSSVFRRMKASALFINAGRGTAVVQDDLAEALNNGVIAGAALDVTSPEPLPPGSPLRFMDNVIITPHCSGASAQNHERNFELFIDLLQRYVAGKRLYNTVDFFSGY